MSDSNRAENEKLQSRVRGAHAVAQEGATQQLAAENKLAAERAKVQRAEAVYAARLDRDSDEPCWELWTALGNAFAGGEQGE